MQEKQKTYPKDGKGNQILGYKSLENSYGISTSFEGNTVYVNRGGAPLERVFGAGETETEKAEVMKNNKVIIMVEFWQQTEYGKKTNP